MMPRKSWGVSIYRFPICRRFWKLHRHSGMRRLAQASDVQLHIGESILTIVVMDSGLALRAPRNDGGCLPNIRKPRRALFHIGADGFGLVGTAQQLLLLDRLGQQRR